MIKKVKKVDDKVVLSVLIGMVLALLMWTCIVVYDIQKDVKDIRATLDSIQETLKSIDLPEQHTKLCYMGQQIIDCP
jgi:hypothetical protein|tara:strand:- start:471 stop:701 length:231 start_codon:yes stop_codon:yes gene_type:complete